MRLFVLGSVVALLALLWSTWLAIVSGILPINADSDPSFIEAWAARTAVIAGVGRRETRGKNPASGENALLDGIRTYHLNCEVCHGGADGVARSIANGLYKKPPQFARSDIEHLPYAYTSWVIRHGIRFTAMPAFSSTLSQRQIDDVALFLARVNRLTPDERFAWSGAPLRAVFRPVYKAIGGFRRCIYLPSPSARPHHFVSEVVPSVDGTFILEHFYNRGISELAVIGEDSERRRLIRARLSKSGTADLAVTPLVGPGGVWTGLGGNGTKTTITINSDSSYTFRSTDAPGFGRCDAVAADVTGAPRRT
jgi:mono/diheme cytochrome c family protein